MQQSIPKDGATLIEKLKLEADYQASYGYKYAAGLMREAAKEIEKQKENKMGTKNPR
jgi:hypothetical protein